MRCLRIGSTQTAPFHLMLSLTWNKVFFITHVSAMCHTKSKSFPLVDGTFLFSSSCFEFSFHFFLFAFIRLLFSRHTILRLQTFTWNIKEEDFFSFRNKNHKISQQTTQNILYNWNKCKLVFPLFSWRNHGWQMLDFLDNAVKNS